MQIIKLEDSIPSLHIMNTKYITSIECINTETYNKLMKIFAGGTHRGLEDAMTDYFMKKPPSLSLNINTSYIAFSYRIYFFEGDFESDDTGNRKALIKLTKSEF
ncbi:MAG: hypothetical protein PHY93_20975 [Bacteriovorax sp.]|nr:hypothetical protein [Bacteriovorax sp.]